MKDPTKVFALSKVFHERSRLAIMSVLATRREEVSFSELLRILKLTKGNLSVHLRTLEESGYIEVKKGYAGRTPRTTYRATPKGRHDFSTYLTILEDIITNIQGGKIGT